MAAMQAVGQSHRPPSHARLETAEGEYLVELDVSEFAEAELAVEVVGREVTVRGDQLVMPEDDGKPFRLRERLRESFRLPDDALADRIKVLYEHGSLEIHVPRTTFRLRQVPIERKPAHLIHADAEPC